MATIADLLIKVRADTGGAEKDISTFGSKVAGGFHKALLPATAALGVMGVVGKAAFDNLQQGANNAKQTEAVLKSTGDASNVTAKHVDDLAMSLRRKAGVDDDVVHSGENMLLTFTNIRNEAGKGNQIFDEATKTMLDMSHALGQDTKSSAIQLGKALNDPIKGITALQRVGVSFTTKQRDQIKTLVESGHTMQAQKLILHELNREFGGSAENIDPTTKAIANMKLNAVDLASGLLQNLMPALGFVIGALTKATAFMTEHGTATKIVVGIIAALAAVVIAVNVAMKVYNATMTALKVLLPVATEEQWSLNTALEANPIGVVVIALAALTAAIVVAWKHSETFRNIVIGCWNAIKNVTMTVVNFVKEHWRAGIVALATILLGPLGGVVAVIATHWNTVKGDATTAWNAVKSTIVGAINAVKSTASSVFGSIAGIVSDAAGGIKKAVGVFVPAFHPVLSLFDELKSIVESVIGAIEKVIGLASKAGSLIHKAGSIFHHIPGFASGVTNFGGGLALVGEQGPELVNLPAGSDVLTNGQTRRMFAGGGAGGPLIGEAHIHNDVDVELLARRVSRLLAFQP